MAARAENLPIATCARSHDTLTLGGIYRVGNSAPPRSSSQTAGHPQPLPLSLNLAAGQWSEGSEPGGKLGNALNTYWPFQIVLETAFEPRVPGLEFYS